MTVASSYCWIVWSPETGWCGHRHLLKRQAERCMRKKLWEYYRDRGGTPNLRLYLVYAEQPIWDDRPNEVGGVK